MKPKIQKQFPANSKTMPKKVKIGYANYNIIQQKEILEGKGKKREELLGLCYMQESEIKICKSQSKEELANTLLHEILHAIMWSQGLKLSESTEEKVVTQITNGLCCVIKDNPELISWLKKSLK
jgi:predicted SprT family Zn-dependent metalloprotease